VTSGLSLPLALLAGGTATRLRPITERIAKSMVEINGTPFIDFQLRLLAREGIRHVTICCGFLHEQIEQHVGTGDRFGLAVTYSNDGEILLGTGGALLKALPLLGAEFMVMYGDSYLDIPFRPVFDAFRRSEALGLMTVLRNENRWDTSNIELRDGRILAYDKDNRTSAMKHIDFGLGCLQAEALTGWRPGERFDLVDVYRRLIDRSQLAAFEVTKRFYEIGSHHGLAETASFLLARSTGNSDGSANDR
jgi:NDP-sugar pyrophosphorylase family protein